jgi:cytosine permease
VEPAPPSPTPDNVPHWLQTTLGEPPLERRRWSTSIAPAYIGLFLWVVYFDQLPAEVLPGGGVGWAFLGAGLAGFLGFGLFYYAPAAWGFEAGRPLGVVATGAFGVRGAGIVPGLLLALVQVVWLAVATGYGTDLLLRGLTLIGLLDPRYLAPVRIGGVSCVSPLLMVTSLVWCLWASLVGRWLVRVIAALMNVYPILPAFLLAASVLAAFGGLPAFRPEDVAPIAPVARGTAGWLAVAVSLQMILGFFAPSGVASADWGAVARSPEEVRRGGLVSVALASWIIATLAVLTVAGALGRVRPAGFGAAGRSRDLTFHAALVPLFGERLAGLLDMAFGLASLAPSVYAAYLFGTRMNELRPRIKRTRWTLVGVGLAWPLIVTGAAFRLTDVFGVVGALVAPVAGVITAEFLRARGRWPGARQGVNPAGMIAWAVGAVAGLLPVVGGWVGWAGVARWQPAVLLAWAAAFACDLILASTGLLSPVGPPIEANPPSPS